MAEIGNFALFCSCDFDLDPMTFIYELYPYPLTTYQQTKNELPTSSYEIMSTCNNGPGSRRPQQTNMQIQLQVILQYLIMLYTMKSDFIMCYAVHHVLCHESVAFLLG